MSLKSTSHKRRISILRSRIHSSCDSVAHLLSAILYTILSGNNLVNTMSNENMERNAATTTFCEVCLGDDLGVYIHEYPVYRHKSYRSPRRSLVGTWCFDVSWSDFVLHKLHYLFSNEQANTNIIYQLIQTRYEDSGKVFRYWNNDTVLILIKKIGEHKVLFNLIVSVLLS